MTGRVIALSPTVWFSDVTIDVGSGDGVKLNDPVVNGDGLIGRVTAVTGSTSKVMLLSDHSSKVSVRIVPAGVQGIVKASVGEPERLVLGFLNSDKNIHKGGIGGDRGLARRRHRIALPAEHPGRRSDQGDADRTRGPGTLDRQALRRPAQPQHRSGAYRGKPLVILTPKITARLVVVGLLGVLLQLTFFSRVELFHVAPTSCPRWSSASACSAGR